MASGMASAGYACVVCSSTSSSYRCPRCSLSYCSLPCYTQHGAGCTESFFKEQCLSAAAAPRMPIQALQETIERVQDLVAEDRDADDWEAHLDRLQDLAINSDLAEEQLPDDIKILFQQYLGDVSKGQIDIEVWKPWWISEFDPDPLEILDNFSSWAKLPVGKANIIDGDDDMPPIISLSSMPPITPELHEQLCDGLLAIVFTLRRHDGNLLTDPESSLFELLSVSTLLGAAIKRMLSIEELVESFLEKAIPTSSVAFSLLSIYDATSALPSIQRLYSELLGLFSRASASIRSRRQRAAIVPIHRKAEFFAAVSSTLSDEDSRRLMTKLGEIWKSRCRNREETLQIDNERRKEPSHMLSIKN